MKGNELHAQKQKIVFNVYFLNKYKIPPTAMQLKHIQFMIYIDINYTTWCSYLCNSLHFVKNLACCSLVDAPPGWSVITLSFEHKIPQL